MIKQIYLLSYVGLSLVLGAVAFDASAAPKLRIDIYQPAPARGPIGTPVILRCKDCPSSKAAIARYTSSKLEFNGGIKADIFGALPLPARQAPGLAKDAKGKDTKEPTVVELFARVPEKALSGETQVLLAEVKGDNGTLKYKEERVASGHFEVTSGPVAKPEEPEAARQEGLGGECRPYRRGSGYSGPPVGKAPKDIDLEMDLPIEDPWGKTIITKAPPPPEPPITPPEVQPTFWGHDLVSENNTVVFVIDRSFSMRLDPGPYVTLDGKIAVGTRLDRAKVKLQQAILSLNKKWKFNILTYDCGRKWWDPSQNLIPATDDAKALAVVWVQMLELGGGTSTGTSVEEALGGAPGSGLNPELKKNKLVVLLTDGEPTCMYSDGEDFGLWPSTEFFLWVHRSRIREANTQHAKINVYGINAVGIFKQFSQQVAGENGPGFYQDVY